MAQTVCQGDTTGDTAVMFNETNMEERNKVEVLKSNGLPWSVLQQRLRKASPKRIDKRVSILMETI